MEYLKNKGICEAYGKIAVNEEVDVGWDIEARRDDRRNAIEQRRQFDNESIVFNGTPMTRREATLRVRAMMPELEEKYPDSIIAAVKPIDKIRNAKVGDAVEISDEDFVMSQDEWDAARNGII